MPTLSPTKRQLWILSPHAVGVAPSQRLKYEQYIPLFVAAGYDVRVFPFFGKAFQRILYAKGHFVQKALLTLAAYWARLQLLTRLHKADVVYVHLWVTPLGPPIFERLVRWRSKALIYDIDDLVYLREGTSKQNQLIGFLKGRSKPLYLMRAAEHVITGTPYLADFARKRNPIVSDISVTINTDTYVPVNPYSNERPLVIGWSGSHSTLKYLRLLDGVLQQLAQRLDFTLLVMGTDTYELTGVRVEAVPWSEAVEVPTLQRMDIGLYPLPNVEWVLGKSGGKALQYMALGIPPVATALGANFRVVEDGVSGYLVRTDDEWLEKLEALANDPALRRRLGLAARERVERYYSLRATLPVYLSILDSVITGKPVAQAT